MALTLSDITTAAALLGGKGYFTPEILANKQYAAWFFGAQSPGQYMYAVPRYKYMFYANFVVNSQAATLYPWLRQLGSVNGISFKIRSIDRPNVELTAKTMNQYNRARVVYTKKEFKPISMVVWDTVDNKTYDLWRQYFTYYFGDARQKSPATMGSSPVDPVFDDSTGWGLRQLGEQVNFFTRLEIYAIYAKQYTRTSYLNPRITMADFQQFEQSESGLSDMKMSIAYETIEYDPNLPITPDIASQFGFDIGPPVPEPNVTNGAAILRSITGVADSLLVQRNANTNSPGALISTGLSAIANFGMASVSYSAFTRTGGSGIFSGDATPGSIKYATATSAFDNVYSTIPYGQIYSDNTTSGGLAGLLGLPFGQLPSKTRNITSPFLTSFATAAMPQSSTLSGFGAFNFGSGGLQTPPDDAGFYAGSANSPAYQGFDPAYDAALPVRVPGQQYGSYQRGPVVTRPFSQGTVINDARYKAQHGSFGFADEDNTIWTKTGSYSGYVQSPVQPSQNPGRGARGRSASNRAEYQTDTFLPLSDPAVVGGDITDIEPPRPVDAYRTRGR